MKLPQFTIRDLLWLVVAAALAVGWWADRSRLAEANKNSEIKLRWLKADYPTTDL